MSEPIALAGRLELFVDDFLIDRIDGELDLRLHEPTRREIVLKTDEPWGGNMCNFSTVLHDGEKYRMYYRTWHVDVASGSLEARKPLTICVATSVDGVHWEKPTLSLYEYEGSKDNNICLMAFDEARTGLHGFSPFIDPRPDCPPDEKFKAVGAPWKSELGLYLMASPDGYTWRLVGDKPILTDGRFDSHNLVYYDQLRGEFRAYYRDFHKSGVRGIKTSTSQNCVDWQPGEWLDFPDSPDDPLYTNNVLPYPRAPHLFVGMPARYIERKWTPSMDKLPEVEHRRLRSETGMRYGTALSDAVFMTSRDGQTFKRRGEAFIRPGMQLKDNWTYGDNFPLWGMATTPNSVENAPDELSIYAIEHYWRDDYTLYRRYSMRQDGFVSVHASRKGGTFITPVITFEGKSLSLNISTSAAGFAKVEIQDEKGKPIEGFSFDDCPEIIGDTLAYTPQWGESSDVSKLAGRPVKLAFELHDADLFSLQFVK